MRPRNLMAAAIFIVAGLAACSSAATPTPPTAAPATAAPASAGAPAAGGATIKAAPVGSIGTVIVAANGMTLYQFSKDTKDSGKSACSGGCATTWPPLTVAAGATPTGDTGVSGKIGTINRDDGTVQVTYNGLPLYFFQNDKAVGDSNGVYTNWTAVKP